jgi:serine protease Do
MTLRTRLRPLCVSIALAGASANFLIAPSANSAPSETRCTELVRSVAKARPSVVNLRGQKTVRDEGASPREVNGMGTGVIIDERGYIITNSHVVEGVRHIEVTMSDGQVLRARVVSADPKFDLAMIKIDVDKPLPVIPIGTSSDLMVAESVAAVGNAYGYEHTVTRGIVSALHRTVQVSDTQQYNDLIQTDASINPGNSGGPLLNVDGEMIGINVAVRAGAQGIGFAIPVDNAMQVAAQLMSIERLDHNWHGVVARQPFTAEDAKSPHVAGVVVDKIAEESPAAAGALKPGDVITTVADQPVARPLDLERALLGRKSGEEVGILVERDGKPLKLSLVLASRAKKIAGPEEHIWNTLGMKLTSINPRDMREKLTKYRGGLKVVDVKEDGPARKQGIRPGDILVGMHVWETISLDNVEYILNRPEIGQIVPVKFYIVRDGETLIGRLPVVQATTTK